MLALGLEFSTQSVKAVLLDAPRGAVAFAGSFSYDERFPNYATAGGVLPDPDPLVRHTSPFMLLEALDACFAFLLENGADLSGLGAVKLDAMQHCTVYTGDGFSDALASTARGAGLKERISSSVTRRSSPIWEDRSTVREARLLEEATRPHGGMAALCGNPAEPRFPAAQILKWAAESPAEYRETSSIFLLSSFMTSILAGRICPVDTGDGWGTNLNGLDINAPGWSDAIILEFDRLLGGAGVTGGIRGKIGRICAYDAPVGKINPYFTARYGVNSEAVVLAGTGDNPATLLGCGGRAVVSLGSSYTVNGIVKNIIPSGTGEYNLFGCSPSEAMALSVITNGGRLHDDFRARYVPDGGSAGWEEYARLAGDFALSDNEPLMLPYLLDESVPRRRAGLVRDGFGEGDAAANIRALHVSQALSLGLHADHLAGASSLCVAGGGARNRTLRQLIADVFRAETWTIENAEYAAALGCAISGVSALAGLSREDAVSRCVRKARDSVVVPIPENAKPAADLLKRYRALELKHARQE